MSASRSRSHATSKHSSNPLPSVSGAGTRSRSHGSRSRSGVSPGLGGASPGGSHGGEPWERDKEGEEAGEIANQDAQDLTIHVIENAKDVLRIKMSHIESSFANALRRVMLAEVPTIAIDTVEVFCNDSVLHDEMLVHRLGLCPIQTIIGPPDNRVNVARKLVYPRDCSCSSYCHKCSITFDLHVRCVDSTRRTVTTHDFVNVVSREADADVQDVLIGSQVQPVHTPNSQDTYPIVIVELARGQEIKVRCIARKGIGKEHGRWNPACTVAMQFVPEINLNERAFAELAASDKARWIRFCPRKVYSFDKARNKVEVNAENVNACFFCDECTQVATEPFGAFKGKKQLVSVRRKKDPLGRYEFLFTIETTGTMTPPELVTESVRVLYEKIADARDSLHNNLKNQGRAAEIQQKGDGGSLGVTPTGSPVSASSPGNFSQVTSALSSHVSAAASAAYSGASDDIPWA